MGSCPCFGSKKGTKPRTGEETDRKTKCKPSQPPDRLPIERKVEPLPLKDGIGAGKTFTYQELALATNDFRDESFIGQGGFGCVYIGKLETGQVVAVKKLELSGFQGEKEFLVEVLMLSLLRHPNLVSMIGYCAEGVQRLLVYEYMPLGCLEDHLHDLPAEAEPLSLNMRLMIAAGAAKGLNYLHHGADPPVIYRDLKTSNILLGDGFQPKLSDFGLAKFGPTGDRSHVSTRVMGTHGYCAPEYASSGKLTMKSDIYSFGVVLLELITGKRALDDSRGHTMRFLVDWARPMLSDRKNYSQLADPCLKGRCSLSVFTKFVELASMCVREKAATRPAISDVVDALDYLVSRQPEPLEQSSPGGFHKYRVEEGESDNNSPKETTRMLNREQAVAEARMWGESWRDKRRQTA